MKVPYASNIVSNISDGSHSVGSAGSATAATDGAYRAARRRVRLLRGWYIHALVYACVIVALWLIYFLSPASPRFAWPLPAMLGWGLGLGIHGLVVFLGTSARGRNWEARKIEQYMDQELAARRGGKE